jgi:tetratricopeptide (TPR) repeat protein
VLLKAGHADEALAAAREELRKDPFDDASWDMQGKILAEKGAFPEAFFDFERAIRHHPFAEYLYDYALALVRADRFDEAQNEAALAVRANGNLVEAHELLGGLFLRKQQLADAAREYRAAVDLRPDLGRARLRLGSILAQQGDKAGASEQWHEAARGSDPAVAEQAARLLRQAALP